MSPDDGRWASAFPVLFANSYVDYADCQLGFTTEPVPDELVARLHLVTVTPQRHVIVCRSSQGWRFLPGGTREGR
jgi:8-oxo-dGTP diphosphatase